MIQVKLSTLLLFSLWEMAISQRPVQYVRKFQKLVKNWCIFGKEAYKKLSYFASFGKQNYFKNFLAKLPFLLVIFKLAILYCVNMYLYIFSSRKFFRKQP